MEGIMLFNCYLKSYLFIGTNFISFAVEYQFALISIDFHFTITKVFFNCSYHFPIKLFIIDFIADINFIIHLKVSVILFINLRVIVNTFITQIVITINLAFL